ncbi:MAG: hypothetical protein KDB61_16695, partial [Planctomycetes bacterium]|nr:hypothetical protein [Planctomycetota bacterium]
IEYLWPDPERPGYVQNTDLKAFFPADSSEYPKAADWFRGTARLLAEWQEADRFEVGQAARLSAFAALRLAELDHKDEAIQIIQTALAWKDVPAQSKLFLVDAARANDFGMYPEYSFEGIKKKAAFHRMNDPLGLRWVIGVGVNDNDIYKPVREQDALLMWASLFSLALGGALAWWLARRMTRPVLELKKQAEEVAAGHLEA